MRGGQAGLDLEGALERRPRPLPVAGGDAEPTQIQVGADVFGIDLQRALEIGRAHV